MTYLERRVLALIEYVRSTPHLDAEEAYVIAHDALDLVARLSKNQKDVLMNICGDLLSVFPALKRHLTGSFVGVFQKYEDELLLLQVQVMKLKREGSFK